MKTKPRNHEESPHAEAPGLAAAEAACGGGWYGLELINPAKRAADLITDDEQQREDVVLQSRLGQKLLCIDARDWLDTPSQAFTIPEWFNHARRWRSG